MALHTDSSESRHAVVTAHVAGAQCPSMGKKPAPAVASASRDEREKDDALPASAPPASDVPAAPTPEPFAREAKHFTETRLLHRDVELFYAGEDKYKNAFFSVRVMDEDAGDPAFDPAVALVRAGLARVADWSVALVPSAAQALRAAEREAKQQRLRLWRAYVPRRRVSAPIRAARRAAARLAAAARPLARSSLGASRRRAATPSSCRPPTARSVRCT